MAITKSVSLIPRHVTAGAILFALLLLTACGGGNDTPGPVATDSPGPDATIEAEPTEVPTPETPSGEATVRPPDPTPPSLETPTVEPSPLSVLGIDAPAGLECETGEIAKWDGSNWVCATDEIFDPPPVVATEDVLSRLTCEQDQVVKWNGTEWACAADVIGVVSPPDPPPDVPLDVLAALNCEAGQIARWDGTDWACADDGTGVSPFFTSFPSPVVIDTDGLVGQHLSAVFGSDGLAFMAYFDETNGDLPVAHCANQERTAAPDTVLDSEARIGRGTSAAIGPGEPPLLTHAPLSSHASSLPRWVPANVFELLKLRRAADEYFLRTHI